MSGTPGVSVPPVIEPTGTARLARSFLEGLALEPEGGLVAQVEQLVRDRAMAEKQLAFTLAELTARGTSRPGGLSVVDWLRALDPGLTTATAAGVATVVAALNDSWWRERGLADALLGEVTCADGTRTDQLGACGCCESPAPEPREGRLAHERGKVAPAGVAHAAAVVTFAEKSRPVAEARELDDAITHLWWTAARSATPEQVTRLASQLGDQIRPPADADGESERQRDARTFHLRAPNRVGMSRVEGQLDPEGAAILRAALDALSQPLPDPDTGVDVRTAARRRADALIELVGRAAAVGGTTAGAATRGSAAAPAGSEASSSAALLGGAKARVIVTIDADVLAGRARGAGVSMQGIVLAPGVVRRMACDAGVIPMVLGADSSPLDVGRELRLVTRALRTALLVRDRMCSFPGCSVPATWCDAHHVVHWADGGPTSLDNLALLCPRHHAWVHSHRLTATIGAVGVQWHRPGDPRGGAGPDSGDAPGGRPEPPRDEWPHTR